ncbi:MAG TPA: ABC transporter permease [Phenylobacterium sp.]|jgi:peptide/nickel transport system permease protein|uniref:ABC transporter permease n=1 Tax=Phenylobacterium sp. TaxID=1871053 RepID=UPI002CE9E959|nr:ABC transporter permease [Phenylobacterium sp.]HXA37479.1 ABC transporter permease [Phenylobacterium sp.]
MGSVSKFILRRLALCVVTIWVISVISYVIIQLPPGDFVSSYVAQLAQSGAIGSGDDLQRLRADYGLDQPMFVRYAHWAWGVLRGNLGWSLDWGRPVADLIAERIGMTLLLSVTALALSWMLALPIAVYCAANRGTPGDYLFATLGLTGVALPNFLLALGVMYVGYRWFNVDFSEVHSAQYATAPPSLGKGLDLLWHLLTPALILGLATTARLIRVMRANLLDELEKPYIVTARAKGMRELNLILKYPLRVALNPFVSTIGMTLPQLVSGSIIVSLVMNLPTVGPLLLRALQAQDMFLASGILLILATLTVLGTLVSDLLLAWLDPRIRLAA